MLNNVVLKIFKLLRQEKLSTNEFNYIMDNIKSDPAIITKTHNQLEDNVLFLSLKNHENVAKAIIPLCDSETLTKRNKNGYTFLHCLMFNYNLKDPDFFLNMYEKGGILEEENIFDYANKTRTEPLILALNNLNMPLAKTLVDFIKKRLQEYGPVSEIELYQKLSYGNDLYYYFSSKTEADLNIIIPFLNENICSIDTYLRKHKFASGFLSSMLFNFYSQTDDTTALDYIYDKVDSFPPFKDTLLTQSIGVDSFFSMNLGKKSLNLDKLEKFLDWFSRNNKEELKNVHVNYIDIIENDFILNAILDKEEKEKREIFNRYCSVILKYCSPKFLDTDHYYNLTYRYGPLHGLFNDFLIENNTPLPEYSDKLFYNVVLNHQTKSENRLKFYFDNKDLFLSDTKYAFETFCSRYNEKFEEHKTLFEASSLIINDFITNTKICDICLFFLHEDFFDYVKIDKEYSNNIISYSINNLQCIQNKKQKFNSKLFQKILDQDNVTISPTDIQVIKEYENKSLSKKCDDVLILLNRKILKQAFLCNNSIVPNKNKRI